jgi:hypothetical protein
MIGPARALWRNDDGIMVAAVATDGVNFRAGRREQLLCDRRHFILTTRWFDQLRSTDASAN